MSSREPLWFCHECNAEMRPLMAPDPVCASCRGTFVEKMENPQDDPREFHRHTLGDGDAAPIPPALEQLFGLAAPPRSPSSPSNRGGESNRHNSPFRFRFSNGSTSRTISFGGGTQRTGANDMTMNDFLQEPIGGDGAGRRGGITGPLMAQYLMALLGRDPMMGGMGGFGGMDSAEQGRMGDYVFNQEALDGIISQIMENSNAHRPVPATEDIIGKLPRDVLEVGSPLLEKDCAVCKEQFKVETEDPDELVVVTLPCKHPFHAPCILPWLKSSGTCPVCRHALIPQPEHHPTNPSPGSSGDEARRPSNSGSPPTSGNNSAGGLLHAIFGTPPSGTGSSTTQRPSSQRRNSDGSLNIPGRWEGDDFH